MESIKLSKLSSRKSLFFVHNTVATLRRLYGSASQSDFQHNPLNYEYVFFFSISYSDSKPA